MLKLALILLIIFIFLTSRGYSYGAYGTYSTYKDFYEKLNSREKDEDEYYGDLDKDRPEVISFGETPKPTEVIICSYNKNREYTCKPIYKSNY